MNRGAVIREWLVLPADERKTKEQAVAYAMRAADRFKFRYKGDRYQLIQIWLFKYIGLRHSHGSDHQETRPMTLGNTMNSESYRHLAAQEAALARAAVSNASRAQHYVVAAYCTRLAEAKERLVTVTQYQTRDASSDA